MDFLLDYAFRTDAARRVLWMVGREQGAVKSIFTRQKA
jgi:hypothetical protein